MMILMGGSRHDHYPGNDAKMSFEWRYIVCMRAAAIFAEDSGDGPDDVNPSANCQHGDDAGCLFDSIP